MNQPGMGNDDRAFKAFRKDHAVRRRQRQTVQGLGPTAYSRSDSVRAIEEDDRREALEMRLRREMFEFVRDTTKLAAGVLSQVEDEQASLMARQITDEMHDFFETALYGTEDLVGVLKAKYGADVLKKLSPKELEAHMAELDIEDIDRYRVEGNETAARLHLGKPLEAESPDAPMETDEEVDAAFAAVDLQDPRTLGIDEETDLVAPRREALNDPVELTADRPQPAEEAAPAAPPSEVIPTELVPLAFARLLEDEAKAKTVLAVLVRCELLSREVARQIFLDMRDLLRTDTPE